MSGSWGHLKLLGTLMKMSYWKLFNVLSELCFVWKIGLPTSYYSYKKEVKFHSVNKKPDQECNKHTLLGSEIL